MKSRTKMEKTTETKAKKEFTLKELEAQEASAILITITSTPMCALVPKLRKFADELARHRFENKVIRDTLPILGKGIKEAMGLCKSPEAKDILEKAFSEATAKLEKLDETNRSVETTEDKNH